MIRKITIFALLFALLSCPDLAFGKKKKDNKDKNVPTPIFIGNDRFEEVDLAITNEMEQINGEWNVVEINDEPVVPEAGSRVYLNFDVTSHFLYGNTGTNAINGTYKLNKDNKISFDDMLVTRKSGGYFQHIERDLLKALDDVTSVALVKVGDTEYMEMKNRRRDVVIKLRRQNLDFMNGPWLVKTINGENVIDRDIKLVNDIDMLTVNITSGCNIINGVITIDPNKEFAIEYEDLKSSHRQCPNIDTETRLLIAMEEAQFCRKRNDYEVELLTTERDEMGKSVNKTLVVLEKVRLEKNPNDF
ncbi:MAG: META domain-containing protein [Muribaculaceae bacterium]|nr:META domain-containing protein [Muribaculaceae bacterium]